MSVGTNFPFWVITPSLSPSPSNDIPTSAWVSITLFFSCSKLLSTHGSGWWFGKEPSLSSFMISNSIGNFSYILLQNGDVVPLAGSITTFSFFEPKSTLFSNIFSQS